MGYPKVYNYVRVSIFFPTGVLYETIRTRWVFYKPNEDIQDVFKRAIEDYMGSQDMSLDMYMGMLAVCVCGYQDIKPVLLYL